MKIPVSLLGFSQQQGFDPSRDSDGAGVGPTHPHPLVIANINKLIFRNFHWLVSMGGPYTWGLPEPRERDRPMEWIRSIDFETPPSAEISQRATRGRASPLNKAKQITQQCRVGGMEKETNGKLICKGANNKVMNEVLNLTTFFHLGATQKFLLTTTQTGTPGDHPYRWAPKSAPSIERCSTTTTWNFQLCRHSCCHLAGLFSAVAQNHKFVSVECAITQSERRDKRASLSTAGSHKGNICWIENLLWTCFVCDL